MTEQTIRSRDIKVADVFQAFYTVPDYQREYVWDTDPVEQLLNDINSELAGNNPHDAPEYFIGSIVVCPGRDGVFELIDGQQRMTTLFLFLCAIRDRARDLGEEPPGALGPQIAATSTDATGTDHFRYRLVLQYEDSGGILVEIAKRSIQRSNSAATRSISNILNAYKVTMDFLKHEFGDNTAELRSFYGYLTNKVKLIRIQTDDVAKALKIFETINDRGVGLDSMDLLKNLLFMKADRGDFEKLKDIWKELQDVIFDMGEKPLRFLRYFVLSRYDVDVLREDQIYGWFAKHERECGYADDPLKFANGLVIAAKAYRHFLLGKDDRGDKNRFLENLRLLGGRAARQHLILLLAGRQLPPELFDRLAKEVEDLFFVYVITREPTRYFERNFARWANDLLTISDSDSLEDFLSRHFVPAKTDLSDRFDDALGRLYYSSVQKYRLRYILAKFIQHIELRAFGETEGTKWLGRFTVGDAFEIEHIFPQTPSEEAVSEFGEFDDADITDRLGNLVLVEESINAALGNRAYSEKRPIYPQSQLLLVKSLSKRPRVGVNTKIDIAVKDLHPYKEWNEATVNLRQDQLRVLAREIWGVPNSSEKKATKGTNSEEPVLGNNA